MPYVDAVLRAAAPDAKVRWAGSPASGLFPLRPDVRFVLRAAPATLLTVAALCVAAERWPGHGLETARGFAFFGLASAGLAGLHELLLARRPRIDYRVTTAGIFVASDVHVTRYELPECEPVERDGDLAFGQVACESLARDGRPFSRWTQELVLTGVGPRAADVRAAIDLARGRPPIGTTPPPRTNDEPGWASWTIFPVLATVLLLPALALVMTFVYGLLLIFVGSSAAWRIFPGGRAARGWIAEHPALAPEAFASATGVSSVICEEVRLWAVRDTGVPPEHVHPETKLADLDALRCESILGRGLQVSIQPVLWRIPAQRRTTVGEVAREVDFELAKGPPVSSPAPAG